MDLTLYAHQGYDDPDRSYEYMLGSDAYMAWRTGQWLRANGADRPRRVISAAGYRVQVDDERVIEVWEDTEPQDVTLR
jgi:hypothetical protein